MDKFVLNVPEWQGELLFTKELLLFVGVIVLMLVGILFCFWGYKYFRTVLFLGIGAVTCYASFLLVEPMTGSLVIRMFLTVSLTFLGICIVYFLDIICGYVLDRLRIRNAVGKNIYLIAAPLGAGIIGLTIYWFFWRGFIVSSVTAAVCGVGGMIFQYFKRAKAVHFKCYNDLMRIPRPEVGEDRVGLTAMAAAAETVTGRPESMAEAVPESAVSDAGVSESGVPESIVPESGVPESVVSESVVSESIVPESAVPEFAVPESPVPVSRITVTSGPRRKHHNRRHKKQNARLAKGAVVAAAGIGLFIAGRVSKGRD